MNKKILFHGALIFTEIFTKNLLRTSSGLGLEVTTVKNADRALGLLECSDWWLQVAYLELPPNKYVISDSNKRFKQNRVLWNLTEGSNLDLEDKKTHELIIKLKLKIWEKAKEIKERRSH